MPHSQKVSEGHTILESDIRDVTNARVLVVDDDEMVHLIAKRILENCHYQYFGAKSAIEALNIVKEVQPELIMSDITMPQIDGLELCVRLKANEELKNIPIIFFTSHSDPQMLANAFEAGACDYLAKPLKPFDLASRAQHHIIQYRKLKLDKDKIHSLDTKNQNMTKVLGAASHDLRNPLVSIRGISQFLDSQKYGPLNETQAELVSTIEQASTAMLQLVNDLVEISEFKAVLQNLTTKPERLDSVLELATTLHSVYAKEKGISLKFENDGSSTEAQIDKKFITRLCDNLISNAVKFSPADTEITIKLYQEKEQVCFYIQDEGPGIPKDEFDKLFKEFSRTSNEPTAGEASSGLGLFLCANIVEAHEGTISVENIDGAGARFTVALPKGQACPSPESS